LSFGTDFASAEQRRTPKTPVQETLWAATRSIGKFRRAAAITTWLFAIVRNTCHRLVRQHRGEEDLADVLPSIPDPRGLIEHQVAAEQVERILANAIAHLDADHREVILLRDVEGFTAPEAASQLSIRVRTLKEQANLIAPRLNPKLGQTARHMVRAVGSRNVGSVLAASER
jgi:RNA polymerase sigma-70 factor (ECF subfamily)